VTCIAEVSPPRIKRVSLAPSPQRYDARLAKSATGRGHGKTRGRVGGLTNSWSPNAANLAGTLRKEWPTISARPPSRSSNTKIPIGQKRAKSHRGRSFSKSNSFRFTRAGQLRRRGSQPPATLPTWNLNADKCPSLRELVFTGPKGNSDSEDRLASRLYFAGASLAWSRFHP